MKLSVLMPVFNERRTIREILARVQAVPVDKEIILVDDASTDGTRDLLAELREPNVKVLFHPANRGKGAAIRAALEAATGDLIVIQDGDLEYDPNDYLKLIRLIEQQGASVAYGNRWHPGNKRISYRRYLLGGRLLTTLANVLYDADIHDEPTCYKMFRAEVIKGLKLTCERFEFCPEVTAKVRRLGYRIHEAPISYAPRGFAEGKKIRWHDGLEAIWVLCKCRFANLKSLRR